MTKSHFKTNSWHYMLAQTLLLLSEPNHTRIRLTDYWQHSLKVGLGFHGSLIPWVPVSQTPNPSLMIVSSSCISINTGDSSEIQPSFKKRTLFKHLHPGNTNIQYSHFLMSTLSMLWFSMKIVQIHVFHVCKQTLWKKQIQETVYLHLEKRN